MPGITLDPSIGDALPGASAASQAPATPAALVVQSLAVGPGLGGIDAAGRVSGVGDLLLVTATGALTARSLADRFADTINVKDFGAKGDGVTDDTAAIQAAHDALGPDGGTIVVPQVATFYNVGGGVTFTKPVRLVGSGWYPSEILSTVNGLTWISTSAQLVVENMGFTASGAAVNTATFIKQLATSSGHNGTLLRNSYFQGALKAYWAQRTTDLHVEASRFAGGSYGLYLENQTSSDEGDSFVTTNIFANGVSGIYVASTSGLIISGNKFNGAAAIHIDIANTTNNVGDFLVTGNSIEGHVTAGVRLIGTTGANTKVLVTGNQFSSSGATHVIVGNKAQNVAITGNTFNDTNPAQGIGIDLQAGAQNVTIAGNAFHQILTAIQSVSTVLGVDVNVNRFAADVTNYWSGEDSIGGQTTVGSAKTFAVSRETVNASDTVWLDVFKVKGDCIMDVEVSGTVQGVGSAFKYTKKIVSNGSTITDAIATVSVGSSFDLQVAAAGGYAIVSVKRTTATGTSVTLMATVRLSGYPTGFLHA